MRRRDFLKMIAASIGAAALGRNSFGNGLDGNPNVLLIFADDIGYHDISLQGCPDFATPNIDTLAAQSVRCTSGYVTAPACGPSRAALLTGRYQGRFGWEDSRCISVGVPLKEVFMSKMFKSVGYTTGHIGKWHLGTSAGQHPLERGFDESYKWNAGEDIRTRCDWYAQKAADFIENHKNEPFFLYLAPLEVHIPLAATQERLDRVSSISDIWRQLYAAMMLALDDMVGTVMAKLSAAGLDENTLVFFINDNGGVLKDPLRIYDGSTTDPPWIYEEGVTPKVYPIRSNAPLRSGKGKLWEGGIRVPYFVRWTGTLNAGTMYEHPVSTMDVFPTVAAVAGGDVPTDRKMDGVNLIPYLKGEITTPPHEFLCFKKETNKNPDDPNWWKVIRKGDWKLSVLGDSTELYNLASDIGEANNVANQNQVVVNELLTDLNNWYDEVTSEYDCLLSGTQPSSEKHMLKQGKKNLRKLKPLKEKQNEKPALKSGLRKTPKNIRLGRKS